MDIGQKALSYHKKGFNCAQSVFAACCEYTGMDDSDDFTGSMKETEEIKTAGFHDFEK